jgi:hypothetical protein
MHRIDAEGAVVTEPTFAAAGEIVGFWSDGDVEEGQPPTVLDQDWHNAIQEEIVAPILAAGLTLTKGTNTQLLAAIKILASAKITGTGPWVITFPDSSLVIQLGHGFEATYSAGVVFFPAEFTTFLTAWAFNMSVGLADAEKNISACIFDGSVDLTGFTPQPSVTITTNRAQMAWLCTNSSGATHPSNFDWVAIGTV